MHEVGLGEGNAWSTENLEKLIHVMLYAKVADRKVRERKGELCMWIEEWRQGRKEEGRLHKQVAYMAVKKQLTPLHIIMCRSRKIYEDIETEKPRGHVLTISA